MADCREMYYSLARRVADIIELLQKASLEAEDLFLSGEDKPPLKLHETENSDNTDE